MQEGDATMTGSEQHDPDRAPGRGRSDLLRVEHVPVAAGRVAVVVMDRPDARNALSTAMLTAWLDALDGAEAGPDVVGLVATGGPRVFSAGADVRERLEDGGRQRMERFTLLYERLTLTALPTVAVLAGPAIGGGAEIAACCDLRVAEPSAWIRFPGAVHGWPVGSARTIGLVGLGSAKDWVLSSRDVARDELVTTGFVQRAVDAGAGLDAALAWIDTVSSRDPDTVAALKRMFNESSGLRDRVEAENDALRATAERR